MRLYITIIVIIATSTLSYAQPNNGFENWTKETTPEFPENWKINNDRDRDVVMAEKSTDALEGNYSILLESKSYEGDSVLAFTIIGDMGDNGPEGGIPVSQNADSLIFWVKYNIQLGDSAIAFIATKENGNNKGFDIIKWVGTSTTWERKSIKVSPNNMDSVVIAFASSDGLKDIAFPGSWIKIDHIQLKDIDGNYQNIPNSSFENWFTLEYENPDQWYTWNKQLASSPGITKTTESHSGTYAVRLETQFYDSDTFRGYLFNGPYQKNHFSKMPFTAKPDSFELYYQYAPQGNDGAECRVELYSGGVRMAEANYFTFKTTSNYERLVIPFSYFNNSTPDSILIVFSSGKNPGSVFLLDDFKLIGQNLSTSKLSKTPVVVYPNPAKDKLHIQTTAPIQQVRVFNSFGQVVLYTTEVQGNTIDIKTLPKGVYSLEIHQGNKHLQSTFIKEGE